MIGTLHKTETGWQVSHATYDMTTERWTAGKFPVHPYDAIYCLDGDDGKSVEFEIKDFWETGLEEVFKVAELVKSSNKEGWDKIFETIEKDLRNELPNRVKNYLRNVYKVPEKTNAPYVSDDFQIGPDGAYEDHEETEVGVEYPELDGTIALCHEIIWDEIYDEFSTDQYPPFGGPFTNALSFIDWLKQNYKSPERIK
jgi:hypothetical protein